MKPQNNKKEIDTMSASIKNINLEWDGASVPEAPTAPESLKEAGLSLSFLNDLLLRTLYVRGGMLGLDLARFTNDLEGREVRELLSSDARRAGARGVESTPTVFVDGHRIADDNLTAETLRAEINQRLQR